MKGNNACFILSLYDKNRDGKAEQNFVTEVCNDPFLRVTTYFMKTENSIRKVV